MPDDKSGDTSHAAGLVFRERNQREGDVGVHVQIVRITVVLVMLFDPPSAVDADQEADEEAKAIVVSARSEHLSVA